MNELKTVSYGLVAKELRGTVLGKPRISITVLNASSLTKREKAAVLKWLVKEAKFIVESNDLAKTYRARYWL